MSNIVGDIAIKVGADISPLVRDMGRANAEVAGLGGKLGGLSKGLGTATAAGAALAGAVLGAGTALAALTRASMDNIDGLSKQARAVGISVASFQAMALVAEEAGVESDKFGKLLIKMQDNIASLNSGTAAQVQQFQSLGLSMSSLAGLGADEQFRLIAERVSAIAEPSERTAAALNIFGKAGADALTMLDGYGAAVDNAAAFQRQFGIAVSDTDAQNIEAANDAMGRLGIAVTGVGNVLAAEFAPAMTAAAEGILTFIENTFSAETAMASLVGSLDEAKALLGEDVYDAMLTTAGAIEENASKVQDLAYEYAALGTQINATAQGVNDTIQKLFEVGENQLAQDLADVLSNMESLRIKAVQGIISYEEMTAQMNAGAAGALLLLEQASAINGIDVSGAVSTFGTFAEAVGAAAGSMDSLVLQVGASVQSLSSEIQALNDIGAENLSARIAAIAAEMEGLRVKAAEGTIGYTEFTTRIAAASAEIQALLSASAAVNGLDVSGAVGTLGALGDSARTTAEAMDFLVAQVGASAESISSSIQALNNLGETDLAGQIGAVATEMESLKVQAAQGTIGYAEFTAKIAAASAEIQALLAQAASVNGLDVSGAVAAFNRLTQAIGVTVGTAAQLRSALPGGTPTPGPIADDRGAAIADRAAGMEGIGATITSSPRPQQAPFELGVPDVETGGGGGGGGGGVNDLETRLQRMRDEFQSESELLQSQFDERLAKLAEFRDAKLLGEEEYNALERQVKADHEKSLADLEKKSQAERLAGVGEAFGQFATLMTSGNQKLFKIGQAAAIAEAVVNGYSAAVSAWEKGMKIGGPIVAGAFAAGSLVKTGALISSIKGQTANSGGGTTGGGGGGGFGGATSAALSQRAAAPAAAAAAPDQSQIVNISLTGDTIGRDGMASLFEQINKGLAKGYRIERVNFT